MDKRQALLVIIISSIIIIPFVLAGPIDDRKGHFIFNLSRNITMQGPGWKLYLVSVGQFEHDGWNFSDYHDQIKQKYIDAKNECGGTGVFYNTVRELTSEEQKSIVCTINGVTNYTHCNMTTSAKPSCIPLIDYKIETDYALNLNLLTFGSYYKSYVYDIKRADFYNHFAPLECTFINGTCELYAYQRDKIINPFIVVLENELTNDYVFFSDIVDISSFDLLNNQSFPVCENLPCYGEITVTQDITRIGINESDHNLTIKFGNYERTPISTPTPSDNVENETITSNQEVGYNNYNLLFKVIGPVLIVAIAMIAGYLILFKKNKRVRHR